MGCLCALLSGHHPGQGPAQRVITRDTVDLGMEPQTDVPVLAGQGQDEEDRVEGEERVGEGGAGKGIGCCY